jgi:23S rRNA G2445 N2-methylase RlmL
VLSLASYIEERFRLTSHDEADLKIQIIKPDSLWEIAIQTSSIPVSMRTYKEFHMSGGIRPSVAYALNRLCHLENAETYLNLCSGSGTLLIEAGLAYPQLRLIGIDHDSKANSMAIRNATKAGLIRRTLIHTASVHALPDVGICDAIVADLPFGMAIAKDDDLHALYTACISYAETHLAPRGVLALYTTEHDTLLRVLSASRFIVEHEYSLHLVTSVHSYLTPRIYICRLR